MKKKNSNILSVNVMIFVKAKANRSHQSFRFNSSHLIPKAKIRKRKYHPFKKTTTKYYYYIYLYDKTKKIIIITQLLA